VTCPNLVPRHHGAAHDRRKPSSSWRLTTTRSSSPNVALNKVPVAGVPDSTLES